METELVKMSPKGQLVVPQEVRKQASFEPGDRFVAMPVEEGVLFKKVDLKKEFERLSKETTTHFKKHKITQKDIDEAVIWARRKLYSTQT